MVLQWLQGDGDSSLPKWSSYSREEVPADFLLFLSATCLDPNALCPLDPLLLKPLKAPGYSALSLLQIQLHTVHSRSLYGQPDIGYLEMGRVCLHKRRHQ